MRKLLLLVPFLLICGCLSPEQQLVGKWQGKMEMDKSITKAMGSMSGIANMFEPQLDLRPDKTFMLSLGPAPIEGSWRLEQQRLILTPQKMMGMSAENVRKRASQELEKAKNDSPFPIPFGGGIPAAMTEMKVAVDKEHDTLTLDPAAGTFLAGFGRIVFKKV